MAATSRAEAIERAGRAAFRALEPRILESRAAFDGRLRRGVAQVMSYEDEVALTCAMSAMPMDEIRAEARERCAAASSTASAKDASGLSEEDAALLSLLRWFKEDFFAWVDKPKCASCESDAMTLVGTEQRELTSEEREGEAGRVEIYACGACRKNTRFPRYNSAIKLLETRRGRCGEWANAFTLCCRAMGYRTRWVLDWTDHVWTEVYSESQKRWLHCDPCENVCDKPLLYEIGWNKSLSYVIAFSVEGVVDVTKRYTKDMRARYRNRGEVYERWLEQRVSDITKELRTAIPPEEVKVLEQQDACEREELDKPAVDIGESLPGRQTGSYAWRAARGELGN
jgi:peptide-N4-(N-acetyl-beta-glucosaminyl)asparagine amidase